MGDTVEQSGAGGESLGVALGPALIETCAGKLSGIDWFRTTWQRGGAATGLATWTSEDGSATPVMVKIPVGASERRWLDTLTHSHDGNGPLPVPRLVASGEAIGGYDIAWVVLERLDPHPLAAHLDETALHELIDVAGRFQAACARTRSPDAAPAEPDYQRLISRARELVKTHEVREAQHWNDLLKRAHKCLPALLATWRTRPVDSWLHGDLPPGNALHRNTADAAPETVLIDLAEVHCGCWVEDAVYLERQYWAAPDRLCGVKPVSQLAKVRRSLGLSTEGDYARVADARRALTAATAPLRLEYEGNSVHLAASMGQLERLLPKFA